MAYIKPFVLLIIRFVGCAKSTLIYETEPCRSDWIVFVLVIAGPKDLRTIYYKFYLCKSLTNLSS